MGIIKTEMIIKANVRTRLLERMVTLIGQLTSLITGFLGNKILSPISFPTFFFVPSHADTLCRSSHQAILGVKKYGRHFREQSKTHFADT